MLAETLSRLGAREDANEAIDAISEAIRIQKDIGAKPELGRSYASLAGILRAQGKPREALLSFEKAAALFDAHGMRWDLERARRNFESPG